MRIAVLAFLAVIGLALLWVAASNIHLQAAKRGRILTDRQILMQLVKSNNIPKDYGWVRPFHGKVILRGTTQECVMAAWHPMYGDGKLVATKEQSVVWVGKDGRAKLIDENYWPPLFRSGGF